MGIRIGADVGGTFTDVVIERDDEFVSIALNVSVTYGVRVPEVAKALNLVLLLHADH